MKNLEEKAAAAASLYVQQALDGQVSQEDCWTAKEDYTAGYVFGADSSTLATSQKINKALRHLADMTRIADGRGDYYTATQARFIIEVLK